MGAKQKLILIILSIVIYFAVYTSAFGMGRIGKHFKEKFSQHIIKQNAKISLCYELPKETDSSQSKQNHQSKQNNQSKQNKWIDFAIPRMSNKLKIITNANIPKHVSLYPEEKVNYAIKFQIIDNKNNIIKSGVYYQNSKITQYTDTTNKKEYTSSYYLSEPLIPADGRVIIFDLTGMPINKNLKVRFSLAEYDPHIFDVVIRLYFPETTPEHKLKYMWSRTGKETREYLARSNIYPYDFLTENEQIHLVRKIWRPLAPLGVEGNDYILRKLYVLKEIEQSNIQESQLPKGIIIDNNFKLTLPIPEKGAHLKFIFSHIKETQEKKAPKILLKWFGINQDKKEWEIPWHGDGSVYQQQFQGGIIELSSDIQLNLLLYELENSKEIEKQEEFITARSFILDENKSITYRVSHIQNLYTPFRVGFRKQMLKWDIVWDTIYYSFFDKNSKQIKRAKLLVEFKPSYYDRLIDKQDIAILSEPVFFYFRIPANVSKIKFSSLSPILINAYNRSPDMQKITFVPEDYYKSQNSDEQKQITWFPLSPLDFNTLIMQQSVLIKLQYRPPEIEQNLYKGNFIWESFKTDNNGHFVLYPYDQKSYQRDSALISNFKQMPLNKPMKIDLKSHSLLKKFKPKLIFYKKDKNIASDIMIQLDGFDYYKNKIIGHTGIFNLPSTSLGSHVIKFNADKNIKLFLNSIDSEKSDYNLKFAYNLTKKGIEFDYQKASNYDETLSVRLFFPYIDPQSHDINKQRLTFTINLQQNSLTDYGPFDSFTILKRQYSVRSDNNGPVYVLNSSYPVLGSCQRCFFPIGSDLKPGTYKIKIYLNQGPEAYLVPYRVTPGIYSERKIVKEAR